MSISAPSTVAVSGIRRSTPVIHSSLRVCGRAQTRKLLWMTGVDRRIPLTATVDGAVMLMAASRGSSGSGP